ncbi:uncharacterized protein I303_102521 [Kwoniella dejecticola CBS 10117]|uniref:RING-type E3 ubiquitin transferase n=1 Tax=Kwoniella dejecticola CBS 10117 TaxID=1296121 RepID=A0A1A6A8Z8_9TREE|nr:uncharacterized protein I303_02535 [Kwoniella dejecticola CBS 10117]OBR86527.1 hypothetical protein I303_02535 [Kwoniella dejecticola CBS 10117]
MDQPIASSSRLPPPSLPDLDRDDDTHETRFEYAAQRQILKSYQRDSSQISKLIDLVSETVRNIAGTRWLARKQLIIDLLVKGVYLSLTFGRGHQTIGEEYTDILPFHLRMGRLPSKRRRIFTILLILLPSLIFSPVTSNYLRNDLSPQHQNRPTRLDKAKIALAKLIDSPVGRIIPELHMMLFLFRGKFFELARRITGVTYVSTQPPKPYESQPPTYEPLGLMVALPLLHRLIRSVSASAYSSIDFEGQSDSLQTQTQTQTSIGLPTPYKDDILPLSPPLTPPLTAEETILLQADPHKQYDQPNTYLDEEALNLPERQCTLCLESRGTSAGSGGTTAVTECGHVFCWGCLGGLEKLECPLCRQALRMERLVAAYNL